jgi:hypothetical protein
MHIFYNVFVICFIGWFTVHYLMQVRRKMSMTNAEEAVVAYDEIGPYIHLECLRETTEAWARITRYVCIQDSYVLFKLRMLGLASKASYRV